MKGTVESVVCPGGRGTVYVSPGAGPRRLLMGMWGGEEDTAEIAALLENRVGKDITPFALAMPAVGDWDRDYTPWPSDEMEGRAFSGGGGAHIHWILSEFLPAARSLCEDAGETGILGYSLGGLFALWAALDGDSPFTLAASVSGALWYQGFEAYALGRAPSRVRRVYVSLGLKEAKISRGPMARNRTASQAIYAAFSEKLGEEAAFEWNNGNHFFEVPQRIAKAVAFLCEINR